MLGHPALNVKFASEVDTHLSIMGQSPMNDFGEFGFLLENAVSSSIVRARVVDGCTDSLCADEHAISATLGGSQVLTTSILAPPSSATNYFMVGSASGTSPGTPLAPGITLPLNAIGDFYFNFSVNSANTASLQASAGTLTLDPITGVGTSTTTVAFNGSGSSSPTIPSAFIGLTFNHAAVIYTFDPLIGSTIVSTTNAVPVTFVP